MSVVKVHGTLVSGIHDSPSLMWMWYFYQSGVTFSDIGNDAKMLNKSFTDHIKSPIRNGQNVHKVNSCTWRWFGSVTAL